MQRAVLRVVQEALTNVHRHARATNVSVRIQVDGARLRLRVADNGRGLPVTKDVLPELGVGVPGMRSRVRQFGGDLSLTSGPRGTTVRALIPLHPTIEDGAAVCAPGADLRVYRNGAVARSD